ncbi:MAG: non-ribosomal peptide synthetase [Symploca sp. SIO2B6]|nr:non-ribosomal peptide synthetase [Symploca sp. SIO2B6]
MNTLELMSHLRSLDIKLSVNGERLECDAPSGALTQTLKLEIAERKLEILKFLKNLSTSSTQQPILPVSRKENLPLSFAQQRLWNLDQLEPGSSVYNLPVAFRLTGLLNLAALEKSLNAIVERHEILRTIFKAVEGQPFQVISPEIPSILSVVDLRDLSQSQLEIHAKQLITKEALQPFDLAQGPLWRVKLLRLAEEEHVLLLVMHHIISDGWSFKVFFRELTAFYEAFCADKPSSLSNLPIQYADFAHWQQQWLSGEVLASELEYWQQQLGGNLEALQLPIDKARASLKTYQGARQFLVVNQKLTEALKLLSRQQGVSLFMTLTAAFKTLLHRYTGQEDIILCSPVACRDRLETEELIGYFNNIVLLRTDLSGDPSFPELLTRVRKVASGAYDHQDVPFQKVVELPNLVSTPLSRAMLVLQNTSTEPPELQGITVSSFDVGNGTANFDLSVSFEEQGGELRGVLDYKTDLFNTSTIEQIVRNFQALLETIVVNPEQKLSELPIFRESSTGQSFDESGYLNGSHSDSKESGEAFVAPRNQLEIQLSEIWEKVLGKKPIGIRDNFFELGGHSLLALRLVGEINKSLGKNLPMSTLFQLGTIEEISRILSQKESLVLSPSLAIIQSGGNKPPLFFLHVLGEGLQHCRPLVSHLDPEQPIYGLSLGLMDEISKKQIKDAAGYYIKELQKIQPEGPYFLAGIQCGGRVAYKIAEQLHAKGQKVALMAMLGTMTDHNSLKKLSFFGKVSAHWNHFSRRGYPYLLEKVNMAINRVKNNLMQLYCKFYQKLGLPLPQICQDYLYRDKQSKGNSQWVFMPTKTYQGRVTLFRWLDDIEFYESDLGWSQMSPGGLEIHDVPGKTLSMLQEPHVQVLAEKFQSCLDQAQAQS